MGIKGFRVVGRGTGGRNWVCRGIKGSQAGIEGSTSL